MRAIIFGTRHTATVNFFFFSRYLIRRLRLRNKKNPNALFNVSISRCQQLFLYYLYKCTQSANAKINSTVLTDTIEDFSLKIFAFINTLKDCYNHEPPHITKKKFCAFFIRMFFFSFILFLYACHDRELVFMICVYFCT